MSLFSKKEKYKDLTQAPALPQLPVLQPIQMPTTQSVATFKVRIVKIETAKDDEGRDAVRTTVQGDFAIGEIGGVLDIEQ